MKINQKKLILLVIPFIFFLTTKMALANKITEDPNKQQLPISSTQQVLQDIFKYDEKYIANFMKFAKQTNIYLDELLLGKVDAKEEYTNNEKQQIVTTLKKLVKQQFSKVKPNQHKEYRSSGGAPGTGKTFALEKMYHINVAQNKFPTNAIYIGPDSVVLPQMKPYLDYCADPKLGPHMAYTKWRDASNYIANFMLIKAITDGLNIVHDTTLTSPKVKNILDTLGNEGYYKEVHFFIADKAIREKSIGHRKGKLGGHARVTQNDMVSKGEAAYERLADHTYEGRVNKYTLYYQQGNFYHGKGTTIPFAVYDQKQSNFVQVLPEKEKFVEHFLQIADKQENLTPELKASVHEFVKTWIMLKK